MNKNRLIIGGTVVILAIGSYWFNTKPTPVSIVSPNQTILQVTILATGQVQTRANATINNEQAGTVKKLVDEGQHVNSGEVLAIIEDKDANSVYQQALANVSAAKLKLQHVTQIDRPQANLKAQQTQILLQQAQRQFNHTNTLAQQQQTTPEALATAQETLQIHESDAKMATIQAQALANHGLEEQLATSALQQAEAQLEQALHRLDRQTVISPFAATVLERKVEVGQYLKLGDALLVLSPIQQQEIIARLDERWLPQLTLNQPATLLADAFPQQKFSAVISHIAPAVNDTRGTIEIRLKSAKWPSFLREGMTVSIELLSQQKAEALVISSSALQQSQSQYWVWLAKDGKAVRQNISIGQRSADQVQVISGLPTNAQIIVSEQPLQAGQRISIRSPSTKGQ